MSRAARRLAALLMPLAPLRCATGTLLRSDFGLGAYAPAVGDAVVLEIHAEFERVEASAGDRLPVARRAREAQAEALAER